MNYDYIIDISHVPASPLSGRPSKNAAGSGGSAIAWLVLRLGLASFVADRLPLPAAPLNSIKET
jgi:hypothetical protein